MAKTKTRRKAMIFTALLLAVGGLATWAFLQKREPVITVQTDKVTRRTLTELVVANGKIQPVVQVKISPEVSGEIIDLPVKEGEAVNKGDLLVKIKPDFYIANRNQSEAAYKSSLASKATAEAQLAKAAAEYKRNEDLFRQNLVSASIFDEIKAAYAVATAQVTNAGHQVEMARAQLASADEQLAKTTIVAPLAGTISRLNSQLGERVLGTVQNLGTDIMTIADLNEMEARVEVGEIDVVLIQPGQKVRLEVDAFKNQKFSGVVTEIANSAKGLGGLGLGSGQSQDATKFEIRIRIQEKESFRPGMSVTSEIETRSRTNALAVPIAAVTTRMPKGMEGATNTPAGTEDGPAEKIAGKPERKREGVKAREVVFVAENSRVKMTPVKIGIADDDYWEITEGLAEGQEIVSGSYRAVSRDLEDGKLIKIEKTPVPGVVAAPAK